jgi:hypothetical protein
VAVGSVLGARCRRLRACGRAKPCSTVRRCLPGRSRNATLPRLALNGHNVTP